MPRLDNDSTDIRQQLEFCLAKQNDEKQPVVVKSSSVPLHNWNSFAAGAGLSAILLLGVPLIYCAGSVFGLPQMPGHNVTPIDSPPMVVPTPTVIKNPFAVRNPGTPNDAIPITAMTRLQQLSAAKSAITGIVDPKTMTASYYWTMILHNDGKTGQEAQMELKLPAGSVVSRATLWINGRAEEAAFNETSNVTHAYQWLVNRRQDPLLITQVAPDRVLIKASPVQHGKDMKLRVGMTVPMHLNEQGEACLSMPQVLASNFAIDCRQDVHLTSSSPLSANRVNMRGGEGKEFVLRGNIKANELRDLRVSAPGRSKVLQVATRATHSNPPAYIVAAVNTAPGADYGRVHYTKTFSEPNCEIVSSEDAAYRVSYLWAHQEIEKLAPTDTQRAIELASIYREVSSVSGAVVLELKSDYTFNGLDRNMYRTTAYTEGSRMAGLPETSLQPEVMRRANLADFERRAEDKAADSGATAAEAMPMQAVHNAALSAAPAPILAPMLQGATNGTIGPQAGDADSVSRLPVMNGSIGPQGSDDPRVTGANVSGTVRVNNIANFEHELRLAGFLTATLGWVLMIVAAFGKFARRQEPRKWVKKMVLGAGLMVGGLSLAWLVSDIVFFIRDWSIFG